MEKIKIAVNGFGRIGRMTARAMLRKNNFDIVAINDLTDTATLAHLFKYDSVHGKYPGEVLSRSNEIIIDGKAIKVFSEKDPASLPWASLGIDVVLESTGRFTESAKASAHIKAGAKKVIITAPMKSSENDNSKTVVLGVNHEIISGDETIVSNA